MRSAGWRHWLKVAWASPCSLLGLAGAAAVLLAGGRARCTRGTLEVTWRDCDAHCGRLARQLPFRGIALGHVILAVTREELDAIAAHEHVHVAQYERWGIFFFPAYALSGLWQLAKGRSPYWHNHFEVQAREHGSPAPRT